MKASDARDIYFATHLTGALQEFYEAISKQAPFGLSGNFYDTAVNYDYAVLRKVTEELEKEGYRVAYFPWVWLVSRRNLEQCDYAR